MEASYVTTGDVIPTEQTFLRGHGTIVRNNKAVAAVSGFVERVNKLVSVSAVRARYHGEVGDVLVGRVCDVGDRKWRVQVGATQDAVLMLSSINLPGGAQRRRTVEDRLQMRALFEEGELCSAEVQSILNDGCVSLHTRTTKYGKLRNGQMVIVPAALVKRCKQHFHTLDCGVDVILGNNGYVWIAAAMKPLNDDDGDDEDARGGATTAAATAAAVQRQKDVHASTPTDADVRERCARVRQCLVALSLRGVAIHVATIMDVYDASLQLGLAANAVTHPDNLQRVTETALGRRNV
jgi:exosome complex component RRP4